MVTIRIKDIDLANFNIGHDGKMVRNFIIAKVFQKFGHPRGAEGKVLHLDVLNFGRTVYLYQMYYWSLTAVQPGSG